MTDLTAMHMRQTRLSAAEKPANLHLDYNIDPVGENWKKYIPLHAAEAYEVLTQDLPNGVQLNFSVDASGHVKLEMGLAEEGQAVISDIRSFNFADNGPKSVNRGDVYVGDCFRGNQYGRIAVRNQIEFGALCGAEMVKLEAAGITGSFLWAEAGFLVDYDATPKIQADLIKRLQAIRAPLRIPVHVYHQLKDILEKSAPEMMQDIVKNPHTLPHNAGQKNENDSAIAIAYDENTSLDNIIKRCRHQDGTVPLGRILLYNFIWHGTADLNDTNQFDRLDSFFRFKYIENTGRHSGTQPSAKAHDLFQS